MNIEQREIAAIKPYERNPRNNDNAVKAVAKSIKQFGFKQPIVIDKEGWIIAGHTRYKAAKELGLEEVPVILADDLTPEQVRAYRLIDNKTGELSSWDLETLKFELENITNIDMEEFGFIEIQDISDMFDESLKEDIKEKEFLVIITCQSKEEQKDICEKLEAEGLKVRAK